MGQCVGRKTKPVGVTASPERVPAKGRGDSGRKGSTLPPCRLYGLASQGQRGPQKFISPRVLSPPGSGRPTSGEDDISPVRTDLQKR